MFRRALRSCALSVLCSGATTSGVVLFWFCAASLKRLWPRLIWSLFVFSLWARDIASRQVFELGLALARSLASACPSSRVSLVSDSSLPGLAQLFFSSSSAPSLPRSNAASSSRTACRTLLCASAHRARPALAFLFLAQDGRGFRRRAPASAQASQPVFFRGR